MKKLITAVSALMLIVFTVTSAFAASVTPISSDMGGDKLAKDVENGAVVKITGDLKHSADNVYYISGDGKAQSKESDDTVGVLKISIENVDKKASYVSAWSYEGKGYVYALNIKAENGNNLYIYEDGEKSDTNLDCYETSGSAPHINYIEVVLSLGDVSDEDKDIDDQDIDDDDDKDVDEDVDDDDDKDVDDDEDVNDDKDVDGEEDADDDKDIDDGDKDKNREKDNSINIKGAKYAYIFGYEPVITFGSDGQQIVSVSIDMGVDDNVTVEQVSSMLMRLLDQQGKTTNKEYPVTAAVKPHEGEWYERGLAYLCSVGGFDSSEPIVLGNVTRGLVAKLVSCALNLNLSSETPFVDISGNEYEEYIKKVYSYGYMNGTSGDTFTPDATTTRAEFCSLFNNILGRNSMGLTALSEDGEEFEVKPSDYYIVDMDGLSASDWKYQACMKATSAYDDDGYVDIKTRNDNIRNKVDKYNSQLKY